MKICIDKRIKQNTLNFEASYNFRRAVDGRKSEHASTLLALELLRDVIHGSERSTVSLCARCDASGLTGCEFVLFKAGNALIEALLVN